MGGPGHGRAFPVGHFHTLNLAPMREPVLSSWDWERDSTDAIVPETYTLRRFRHSGFKVLVRLWVHDALWPAGGDPNVPEYLLPEILRTRAYEVCGR